MPLPPGRLQEVTDVLVQLESTAEQNQLKVDFLRDEVCYVRIGYVAVIIVVMSLHEVKQSLSDDTLGSGLLSLVV